MSFHDEMMSKAQRIAELAGEHFDGLMYMAEHGTPWAAEFASYTEADPDAAGGIASAIEDAQMALSTGGLETLGLISAAADPWIGEAARTFREDFVPRLHVAVQRQEEALLVLSELAQAHRDLVTSSRNDLREIADQTIDLLGQVEDGGTDWVTVTLTVVTAIAVIGSAVPTGGASASTLPLVFAVTEATAGAAMSLRGSTQVGGTKASEILESLKAALDALSADHGEIMRGIALGLAAFSRQINGPLLGHLRPHPPFIVSYPMSPLPTDNPKSWDLDDFALPEPG